MKFYDNLICRQNIRNLINNIYAIICIYMPNKIKKQRFFKSVVVSGGIAGYF